MLVVHVHIHVKPESIEEFRAATIDNARESLKEPGIVRFDVAQEVDRPERFVLVEAYSAADAPARHKETAHYARWRDAVADMMAEVRQSTKYGSVYPDEGDWG